MISILFLDQPSGYSSNFFYTSSCVVNTKQLSHLRRRHSLKLHSTDVIIVMIKYVEEQENRKREMCKLIKIGIQNKPYCNYTPNAYLARARRIGRNFVVLFLRRRFIAIQIQDLFMDRSFCPIIYFFENYFSRKKYRISDKFNCIDSVCSKITDCDFKLCPTKQVNLIVVKMYKNILRTNSY